MSALLTPLLLASFAALAANPAPASTAAKSEPIPMDQIGAVAGKQYQGDGLSVTATPEGARLRCVFQKLEGQATLEGLWLTSTTETSKGERFRVVASQVGRSSPTGRATLNGRARLLTSPDFSLPLHPDIWARQEPRPPGTLTECGKVELADNLVRFLRPGLTEEYSVSVDGVRQDFLVLDRPAGAGQLRVELDVAGARAEASANGARLVLDGSGRKIAYTRLRATDATGKELPARMVVEGDAATGRDSVLIGVGTRH